MACGKIDFFDVVMGSVDGDLMRNRNRTVVNVVEPLEDD
jgi:hypothetical protein